MTNGQYYTNGQDGRLSAVPYPNPTGDFVSALQDAVRENPISAALIGMGVLWLFTGGSSTSLFGGGGRKSIFRSHSEPVSGAGSDVGSSVRRLAESGAEAASQVVRQASGAVGDAASRTGAQAADALSTAYGAATDIASQSTDAIAKATSSTATTVQKTAAQWGSTIQQNLSDLFERQPLVVGVVGLAIGAGIAASIRTTEAEKRTFGNASDFVRETMIQKVAEAKEMADAALKEANAQGLTPEAGGEALRIVGDKVTQVVGGSQSGAAEQI
ncbi:MAG TPA: hypothetical protein VGJ21_02395 [Terracidiphilus sp.]